MTRLGELTGAAHRSQVLKKWMARWKLALQRARALAGREQQRGQMLQAQAWAAWRQRSHEIQLFRALEVAAQLHRQAVVLRHILDAWRAHAAALRQVDLPADHPVMVKARQQQRRRHLSCVFQVGRCSQQMGHSCMPGQQHYAVGCFVMRAAGLNTMKDVMLVTTLIL